MNGKKLRRLILHLSCHKQLIVIWIFVMADNRSQYVAVTMTGATQVPTGIGADAGLDTPLIPCAKGSVLTL